MNLEKDDRKRIHDSHDRFDKLLSLIESADQPKLKNYSGNIRDGVVYFLSWGSKERMRDICIRNPRAKNEYLGLIQKVKESAWT